MVQNKNMVIKEGDLVKLIKDSPSGRKMGYRVGTIFRVLSDSDGSLVIKHGMNVAVLVDAKGALTDWTDIIVKHVCPVMLPYGLNLAGEEIKGISK